MGQTPKCFDHAESVYDLVELGITSIPLISIAVTWFFINKSLPAKGGRAPPQKKRCIEKDNRISALRKTTGSQPCFNGSRTDNIA